MNILHIGLPKSASTTLQNRVFSVADGYLYVGKVDNRHLEDGVKQMIVRIRNQRDDEFSAGRERDLLERIVAAKNRASICGLMLSDEILSTEGGQGITVMAQRLQAVFAPAKVLIVLRSQYTLLQSLYMHMRLSAGERRPIGKWLQEFYGKDDFHASFRIPIDYEMLVRRYEQAFGAENVEVLLYEDVIRAGGDATRVLNRMFGVPQAYLADCLRNFKDNQRMSKRMSRLLGVQALLHLRQSLALIGRRYLPLKLYTRLHGWVTSGEREAMPEIPDEWRQFIDAGCAEGNARLMQARNLKLAEFGYPLTGGGGHPTADESMEERKQ